MKKPFLLLCLTLCLSACGQQASDMERVSQQLADMHSYSCSATMTRATPKGQAVYETKQYFREDGAYRLEITAPETAAGNYTVFDGEKIAQYNPNVKQPVIQNVPENKMRNELFLGQFYENYLSSQDVSVETAALDESKCVVLEAIIPEANEALATEKLWVDTETLLPVRLCIYGEDGTETFCLDYSDFVYNPDLDDALFTIPE